MIRKETWLVLVVFAVLIGYAVYLNNQKKASSEVATPLPASAFLINASEGQPTSIEVKSADGQSVKLVRGPRVGPSNFLKKRKRIRRPRRLRRPRSPL